MKTVTTYSPRVSQKVRSNRLQVPLRCAGQRAHGLEVLLGTPATGDGGEGSINDLSGSHDIVEARLSDASSSEILPEKK